MSETLELLGKLIKELIEKEKRMIEHFLQVRGQVKLDKFEAMRDEIVDLHNQINSILEQQIELQRDLKKRIPGIFERESLVEMFERMEQEQEKRCIIYSRDAALVVVLGISSVNKLKKAYDAMED